MNKIFNKAQERKDEFDRLVFNLFEDNENGKRWLQEMDRWYSRQIVPIDKDIELERYGSIGNYLSFNEGRKSVLNEIKAIIYNSKVKEVINDE